MQSNDTYSLYVKRSPTFKELDDAGLNYEQSAETMYLIEHNCPTYPAYVPCFPVRNDNTLIALGFQDGWQLYIDDRQAWCYLTEHPAPEWEEVGLPHDS